MARKRRERRTAVLPKNVLSGFALIDITSGREKIADLVGNNFRIPFTITGFLQGDPRAVGNDDGESREFAADVTTFKLGTPMHRPTDVYGRPWAHTDELKPGHMIELDDGFTCVAKKRSPKYKRYHRVHRDGGGLYFECKEGKHYLAGQLGEHGELIGVYPALG